MNAPVWLNKLERKFGKYAIPGLMNIMIMGMAIIFIMDNIVGPMAGKVPLAPYIVFSRDAILSGQIWRLITFVFDPMELSPFFLIFTLYFYWLIGTVMENQWGTFRFNIFYFCGVIGTIIGGFITGYTSNTFLTLSLFIAFAAIAPDFQLMLFFFIPVKIKYLAMFDGVILLISFFSLGLSGKIAIVMSLINLLIFFGKYFIDMFKMKIHHWKYKLKNRK